jgi:RNA 2',3'-cyclic 3'-phosphodiesterase
MMRLFLGIELPDEIKEHIHEYAQKIQSSSKGWVGKHDYHLTLLFIGEVDPLSILPMILERVESIKFDPFHLLLTGPEFFPRRILYIGAEKNIEVQNLYHQISELFPEWATHKKDNFTPHITIKRWQRIEVDDINKKITLNKFDPRVFSVGKIALFKSEKDPLNRKYHVLHRN